MPATSSAPAPSTLIAWQADLPAPALLDELATRAAQQADTATDRGQHHRALALARVSAAARQTAGALTALHAALDASIDDAPTADDLAMLEELIEQASSAEPMPELDCPDGGTCTHWCDLDGVCWRTRFCEPLTRYVREHSLAWPEDTRPRPRTSGTAAGP